MTISHLHTLFPCAVPFPHAHLSRRITPISLGEVSKLHHFRLQTHSENSKIETKVCSIPIFRSKKQNCQDWGLVTRAALLARFWSRDSQKPSSTGVWKGGEFLVETVATAWWLLVFVTGDLKETGEEKAFPHLSSPVFLLREETSRRWTRDVMEYRLGGVT